MFRKNYCSRYESATVLVIHPQRNFFVSADNECSAKYYCRIFGRQRQNRQIKIVAHVVYLLGYKITYKIARINCPYKWPPTHGRIRLRKLLNTTFVVVGRFCFCRCRRTCRPTIVGRIFGRQRCWWITNWWTLDADGCSVSAKTFNFSNLSVSPYTHVLMTDLSGITTFGTQCKRVRPTRTELCFETCAN
jgi:hypothetical protein